MLGTDANLGFDELIDAPGEDFCRGIFVFQNDEPVFVLLGEFVQNGIVGVDQQGMVVLVEVVFDREFEGFEVTDHVGVVEGRRGEHEIDTPRVSVGESASAGMLGKHVPGFNFKGFANAVDHGRDGRKEIGGTGVPPVVFEGRKEKRKSQAGRLCHGELVNQVAGALL